jgi:hypothetical protein
MAWVSNRMPVPLRYVVYAAFGLLWCSGCFWLVLDRFYASRGPFGATPHPWEPAVLLLHGIAAIAVTYLLGWVAARHAVEAWQRNTRRVSGGFLAGMLAVLSLSGFALYYLSDDRWQHATAILHELVGLALIVSAVQHVSISRRRDMRSAASRP